MLVKKKRVGHTIFSIVLVMLANWNMSSVLTTTAGVVKKNSTMNKKLFIRNDLRYQKRDGIAKFPLLKKIFKNWNRTELIEYRYQLISSGRGAKSTDQE
jgi:hypothetical protein